MSKWLAAPRKHGREPRLSLTCQQLINTKAITDWWKDILHEQRKGLTKMSLRFAPVGKKMAPLGKNMHPCEKYAPMGGGGGGQLMPSMPPGQQR
jgi:hypothetical protein